MSINKTAVKENVIVWNQKVPNSNMDKFKSFVNKRYDFCFETYWDLHEWSVNHFEDFWESVWIYFDIIASKKYQKIYLKTGPEYIDCEWFPGARFNYAENLLRHRDDKIAVTYLDEMGNFEKVSFKELYEEVKLYAAAFRSHGLQKGDVIACYLSNRMEAVFVILAALSIGAIAGGIEPYAGNQLVIKLGHHLKPKILFTEEGFQWHDRKYSFMEKINDLANELPNLEKIVFIPLQKKDQTFDISKIKNSCFLQEFLEQGKREDGTVPDIIFEQLPANHPIFIIFSSGTTGSPKCLVHTARALLPQLVEGFHFNMKENDVVMNQIPAGWNIWYVLLISLALGVNLFLCNCSYVRVWPNKQNIWDIISKYKVKLASIAPVELDILEQEHIVPKESCNLKHFKIMSISASPVKLHNYEFLLKYVKKNLFIGNSYGSSELLGSSTAFDLNLPNYALECQVPSLSKKVLCLNEKGIPIYGEVGDLVVANPSPSFALYILGDTDNKFLKQTYLAKYPGYWFHKDQGYINPETKGLRVVGRSDDCITNNGFKFAASEIYSAIFGMEEISDSICVGQVNKDQHSRAVLFVKLKENYILSDELKEKISQTIENHLNEFYVPEVIVKVKDIPVNLRGKKLESVVQSIINKKQIPSGIKIRNPESLKNFMDIPVLINY